MLTQDSILFNSLVEPYYKDNMRLLTHVQTYTLSTVSNDRTPGPIVVSTLSIMKRTTSFSRYKQTERR